MLNQSRISSFVFRLPPNLSAGYTLIELLVTVTIITILTTLGVTAYGRAAEIQATKADTEKIIEALTSAQKAATSGKADCTETSGKYLGESLSTSLASPTITIVSSCEYGNGAPREINLTRFSFASTNQLTFRPLNQGIDTGSSDIQTIDYTDGSSTYRIEVGRSGSIKSLGKTSP
jgi:prepilin-type N-terminal cleavage/methylation domain-containing protein